MSMQLLKCKIINYLTVDYNMTAVITQYVLSVCLNYFSVSLQICLYYCILKKYYIKTFFIIPVSPHTIFSALL